MEKQLPLYKWLALAALAEWLLVRTITRAAIHVPKSPGMISTYSTINQIGQVAAAFVALLALFLLLWIARSEWQTRRTVLLPLTLAGLAGLSLLLLLVAPPTWLALLYQLLAATAVLLICAAPIWGNSKESGGKMTGPEMTAWLFPAGVLLAGLIYQLLPGLYALLSWPGPPPFTGALFNLGEVLVIGSVLVWWWIYGRTRTWYLWVLAAIPALLFVLSFQRDPAMTGILTIWSTGLTLFLPWPAYALGLWLAGVTVLVTWRPNPPVAYAISLLIAAGYAPQLSSQLFCALIALWLLTRPLPLNQKQDAHIYQTGAKIKLIS